MLFHPTTRRGSGLSPTRPLRASPRGRAAAIAAAAVLLLALVPAPTALAVGTGSISGIVTGPDGSTPVAGIEVVAASDVDWRGGGTDSEGAYSVTGLAPGSYRVSFDDWSGTYPRGYYATGSPGNFTTLWDEATPVPVTDANVALATVNLPTGFRISGTVTGPGGAGLTVDISVCAWGETSGGDCTEARTATDGTYRLTVVPGSYRVNFDDWSGTYVDGFYDAGSPGNFTADWSSATLVTVTAADVAVGTVNLPTGYRISGTVFQPDGTTPAANIWVQACSDASGGGCTGRQTGADGTYRLTVVPGSYFVGFNDWTGTYPRGFYAEGSGDNFTTLWSNATLVNVTSADVPLLDVTLPVGYRISGTVTGPDGTTPVANIGVNACPGDETSACAWGQTAANGTYRLTVVPGSYFVGFNDWTGTYPDGYYAAGSPGNFTTLWSSATLVSVTNADVANINIQYPDTTPPSGTVSINSDAATTPSANVSVAVPATDSGSGLAKVSLSNNADMSAATTLDYSSPVSWTLTSGDGTKTVYVRWQDAVGNWSAVASDSITLVTPPPPAPAPPAGGVTETISVPGVNGLYSISVAAGTEVQLVDPFGPGTSITIKFTSAVTGSIVVTPLTVLPTGVGSPPGDSVVALFSVELGGGISNAAISSVTFRFQAPASLTNVALQHYSNGTWTTLTATPVSVSGDIAMYEATSSGFSVYAVTGARVAPGASASAYGVTRTAAFSASTKVAALGKYVTVKFSLGAAYAGKTIPIWTATKSASGVWSKFGRTTSRIADARGDVYYFVRSSPPAWKSFQARFDRDGSLAARSTASAQVRWR